MIISRSVLLKIRNVSDKFCRESLNTHFVFSNFFFEILGVYETMWKNMVQPDRQQMIIWRMRIECWKPKATNAHSEYLTHCFPMTTVVVGTRLNITVYVHCLSCFIMATFSSKLLIPDRWHS